jgi:hypothetical protein
MLDARCSMLDARCSMLDARPFRPFHGLQDAAIISCSATSHSAKAFIGDVTLFHHRPDKALV